MSDLKNILISVIVPVYNVELFLPKCIESILSQTYNEFELLLIDDGSTDKSGELCDNYAQQDNRIKVVHKNNGGVSSARNKGIQLSQGRYICFVDADDWLEPDYFSLVSPTLAKQKSQLLLNNWFSDDGRGHEDNNFVGKKSMAMGSFKALTLLVQGKYFGWGPMASFYGATICKKNLFNEKICFGEDVLFKYLFIKKMGKENMDILYMPLAKYHYVCRADSASNSYNVSKMMQALTIMQFIMQQEKNEIGEWVFAEKYIPLTVNLFRLSMQSKDLQGKKPALYLHQILQENFAGILINSKISLIIKIKVLVCFLPHSLLEMCIDIYVLFRKPRR